MVGLEVTALAGDDVPAFGGLGVRRGGEKELEALEDLVGVLGPADIVGEPHDTEVGDDADYGQAGQCEREAALRLALCGAPEPRSRSRAVAYIVWRDTARHRDTPFRPRGPSGWRVSVLLEH